MTFFISTAAVEKAYEELCFVEAVVPSIIHIFLILKGVGYNATTFQPISLINEYGFLPAFKLSSLFSQLEQAPDKYDFISPFEMSEWHSQSPSEKLKKWVSVRVKNNILGGATTWRSIITDDPDKENVKFKHDYLNEIADKHLGANKISIVALSIWVNRFTEFDEQKSPRQLIDIFINDFHLTNPEIGGLFNFKTQIELTYSQEPHNPKLIRDLISGKPASAAANWSESVSPPAERDSLNFSESDFLYRKIERTNMDTKKIYELLTHYKQVILTGPPGTSKSYFANEIATEFFKGNTTKIQFHPKFTYQDFIGGYIVKGTDVSYENGILINLIESIKGSADKYLLIIDEINRANVGQVFGETIQILDRGNETEIRIDGKLVTFELPDNLYILATMNSSDRSLGAVDFAIRRRFGIAYCPPDEALLADLCTTDLNFSLTDFLRKLNSRLAKNLKNQELAIGHTYLINSQTKKDGKHFWGKNELSMQFSHKILPMVEEFCHGNQQQLLSILGEDLPKRLNADEFVIAAEDFINAV